MGKSGTFDNDTGEIAPQAGEFLAGVLALARISRVTVALESGHGAGAALLAAARLTSHAETCVLFDRWNGDPTAALGAALLETDPDFAAGDSLATQTPQQLLHALQAGRRQSFLLIFDRFDQYLTQNADPARSAGFDRAFVRIASDSELDVHMLLVLDEAAEGMLERYQDAIPGIGDGCLRMPAGGLARGPADAPAQSRSAARRDRSFGMLLERLTAIAPAQEGDASAHGGAQAVDENVSAPADAPARAAFFFEEAQPAIRPPDAPRQLAAVAATVVPTAAAAPATPALTVTPSPAAQPEPAPLPSPLPDPAAPRRAGKTVAVLLSVVLALGAGVYAYRQQAGSTTASAVATPEKPATPGPALMSAPALADAGAKPDIPAAPVAAPNAAPAAAAASAAPRLATTVHVHVRNQRERERVQAVAGTLAAQGIRLVDVKVMSKGPGVADLRYFHEGDREEAMTVQKALRAAGVAVPRLSRMTGFESITRPHQFEVWLSGDSTATPARR